VNRLQGVVERSRVPNLRIALECRDLDQAVVDTGFEHDDMVGFEHDDMVRVYRREFRPSAARVT
jgi:hypothetical protein